MKEEDEAVLAIKDLTISMHSFTFALALFALVEELPEDFDFSLLSKLQQLSTKCTDGKGDIRELLYAGKELEDEISDYPASEESKELVIDCIRDFRKLL